MHNENMLLCNVQSLVLNTTSSTFPCKFLFPREGPTARLVNKMIYHLAVRILTGLIYFLTPYTYTNTQILSHTHSELNDQVCWVGRAGTVLVTCWKVYPGTCFFNKQTSIKMKSTSMARNPKWSTIFLSNYRPTATLLLLPEDWNFCWGTAREDILLL